MRVRALKSFGSSQYGHKSAGMEFDLPPGVDWLRAGLVEAVEPETATMEAAETAVKLAARRRTKKKAAE